MGETHVPEAPKKIHGDKLAEAFREPKPDISRLPRHPASTAAPTEAEAAGTVRRRTP
ncbi:hypothetical protein Q0Z83_052040 [Actinoplanes sichuanensis]|uniref:Uncharacterized protein n=1 Tax=Actinoplanes sichuanensis TaxID=512349 RepID=A0ABW4ATM9_9ACTN|nr:hypothetical protein [Actinoplanes sichuanensis]BEL07013.1 hypothetical protein Q0Z83_052040 [Actinoplanes sichuanensis]